MGKEGHDTCCPAVRSSCEIRSGTGRAGVTDRRCDLRPRVPSTQANGGGSVATQARKRSRVLRTWPAQTAHFAGIHRVGIHRAGGTSGCRDSPGGRGCRARARAGGCGGGVGCARALASTAESAVTGRCANVAGSSIERGICASGSHRSAGGLSAAPSGARQKVTSRGVRTAPAHPHSVTRRPYVGDVGVLGSSYRGAPCMDRCAFPRRWGESLRGGRNPRLGVAERPSRLSRFVAR
jgi:hypothetical protein